MEFTRQNFYTIIGVLVVVLYTPIIFQLYLLRQTLKKYHAEKNKFKT